MTAASADAAAATGPAANSRHGETVSASAVEHERFGQHRNEWQKWWLKTAVSGINGELAEAVDAAGADGVRNLEDILKGE